MPDSAFTVYNAAAGAGKTYTLVKAYLLTLLKAEFKDGYKNILALTFTNKAVAEMKTRILENLVAISQPETPKKQQLLLQELIDETGIPEPKLKQKANQVLKSILHNYAAFDIVTIDTFTHRVIRTFAYDLGIPVNFEIEMDTESLIEEAVNAVLAKVGIESDITRIIIDFALSKIEDDKSWDITSELNKTARLLYSENDRNHLNPLKTKTLDDFQKLETLLKQKITVQKESLILQSNDILKLIQEKGIDHKDFTRGAIPSHFEKIAEGDLNIDFGAAWKQNIDTTNFYNKSLDDTKKEIIDAIRPQIEHCFLQTKKSVVQIDFFQNIIKNLVPLSVLNAINKELIDIKKERKILLISEFNNIISKAIQNQPAPFIYERLGERYRDYFIDEFQDTSELQWTNLIPLIDNALSTETLTGKRGQLTIVGDAKQAIYRWRGGKAEQFIDLSNNENPFSIQKKQVLNLPKNYRSLKNIVTFNNDFFTFISKDFSDQKHTELYIQGNQQDFNTKEAGYINISFIKALNNEEENEVYPERVYEIIHDLKKKGYNYNDICILVRRQKEGIMVANYLTEQGLSIISSETLLINNAPEVRFIINILSWHINENDQIAKIQTLNFIAEKLNIKDKHSFFDNMIGLNKKQFSLELNKIGFDFNPTFLTLQPLYNSVEYIIECFHFDLHHNAYLQFFLDVIFSFSQKHTEGISGFLDYWLQKKDKLSIIAPEDENAIQIMTIHKAKGLEFPCVIYPFANTDIYKELEPKTWLSVEKENYADFDEVFINYSKKLVDYGELAKTIVEERQSKLELDNINLLYVAFTRAEEQLYIISKSDLTSRGEPYPGKFSGKLISFLQHKQLWNAETLIYEFGNPNKTESHSKESKNSISKISLSQHTDIPEKYRINIITNAGKLWNTAQQEAIEKGNLIHDLLSNIYTEKDIIPTLDQALQQGVINSQEQKYLIDQLKKIVKHSSLSKYFSDHYISYNEREIIAHQQSYRPDKIVTSDHKIFTIIDYKTGDYSPSHKTQIQQYATILEQMGYQIGDKILIYINENIDLKHV